MKQIVKPLLGCLIVLSINGCGLVWGECVTPDVASPKIDNTHCTTTLGAAKQCVKNYLSIKQYAEALKEANEVCK